ncbi:MAG TPA: hypothetical protein VK567_17880, partial [Bradyrhizobium sp.]|nr:hypothetical protein [Bradyrhizobium sp.]
VPEPRTNAERVSRRCGKDAIAKMVTRSEGMAPDAGAAMTDKVGHWYFTAYKKRGFNHEGRMACVHC